MLPVLNDERLDLGLIGVAGGVMGSTILSVLIVSNGELVVAMGGGRLLSGIAGRAWRGRRMGSSFSCDSIALMLVLDV